MNYFLKWNPFGPLQRVQLDWRVYALMWYFSLPLIIFFIGWFKLSYALPGIASAGFIMFLYKARMSPLNWYRESLIALFSFVVVLYSGNGEFNFQTYDHFKHNFIFADLVKYDWPVYYQEKTEHLNYYLGYYVWPSLVGKFFGIQVVAIANLFFLSLGIYLCISYLMNAFLWSFYQLALFIFYGASAFLIVFLRYLTEHEFSVTTIFDNMYAIWTGDWGSFSQIPIFESLKWVPQHFLPTLAFFVFYKLRNGSSIILWGHFLAIILFWSVYVFLASSLFILFMEWRFVRLKWDEIKLQLPSLVLILLLILYYIYHAHGARNTGNFNFFNLESIIYLVSSLLAFSLPISLMSYLYFGEIKKTIQKTFYAYFVCSMCLAFPGDFDLFARGTLIFQIAMLWTFINDLKSFKCNKISDGVFKHGVVIIFLIIPGFIGMAGPPLYHVIKNKALPRPLFTIENAFNNYNSVKEHYCAMPDFNEIRTNMKCDDSLLIRKYLGDQCFLLK